MVQKFWRWGDPEKKYDLNKRPFFFPYLKELLDINNQPDPFEPDISQFDIASCRLTESQRLQLQNLVGEKNIDLTDVGRLAYSFGKSYHDLIRIRTRRVDHISDAVIFPQDEKQIRDILNWAEENRIAVVPFGGGTSVVGGVGAYKDPQQTAVITLVLAHLNKIISIDKKSMTADVQAGIMGPELEKELQRNDLTMAHYPESFEFSTLGGWIAARSAGQQSTKYGKIEQMVESLSLISPGGNSGTHPYPAAANGPDINQVLIGSEGSLGIITQAKIRLKKNPARKVYLAWLMDSFENGTDFMRRVIQSGLQPAMLRLSDEQETRFIFALREKPAAGIKRLIQEKVLNRAHKKGFKAGQSCFLLAGFEGSKEQVAAEQKAFSEILQNYKTFSLGKSPGDSWYKNRFNNPYLRDVLLDYEVLVDTLETAGEWKKIESIYQATKKAIEHGFKNLKIKGAVTVHISHVYPTGASLYFIILASVQNDKALDCWRDLKSAASSAIVESGGTISHHHGIGRDHRKWLAQSIGDENVALLRKLKQHYDPGNILNPGKLLPPPVLKAETFDASLRSNDPAIEFSYKRRRAFISRLKKEKQDILVIGGGITGAGVARDAAIRGFRTALIEKDDFASGTSSKSSKLVHGGFRYLKNLEFGLVHEALMERKTLMEIAPHLVHPIQCLLPVYKGASVPGWMIQLGMLLYDGLSFTKRIGLHKMLSVDDIHKREPALRKEGLEKVFMYYDSRADDTRLVMANIQSAVQHGAGAVNYLKAIDVVKVNDQVTAVKVRDEISGEEFTVEARVVANASGPWCDVLRNELLGETNRRIRTTKGIHLLLSRKDLPIERTMILSTIHDDRPVFVIPWRKYVILGTTDTDFSGDPDWVGIEEDDVDYLLETYNYYFPKANLTKEKIVSAYSGLRPLTFEEGKSAGEVTREYQIFESPENFFSIIGGKLTTYRTMAEELVDRLMEKLENKYDVSAQNEKCITDKIALYGGDIADFKKFQDEWLRILLSEYKFDEDIAVNFIEAYGSRIADVLSVIEESERGRERIISTLPYVWGEIDYAVRHEMAIGLDDIMLRRLHLFSLDKKQGWDAYNRIAQRMAELLNWSEKEKTNQIERYKSKVELVQSIKKN